MKVILAALAVAVLAVPALATGVAQASSTTPPSAKRVGHRQAAFARGRGAPSHTMGPTFETCERSASR